MGRMQKTRRDWKTNQFTLKSRVTGIILGVSLGSLLIVGVLGWLQTRSMFRARKYDSLTNSRIAKQNEIETFFQTRRNHVATLSEDQMVVSAMVEFGSGLRDLQSQFITPDVAEKLEFFYQQSFFPRLTENIGGTPEYENYRPSSQGSQYLQYHYIANNVLPIGQKDKWDDAEDGSEYSRFHAKYHPLFRNLINKFGYEDLYLIDFDSGEIIYSVAKKTDYATNLNRGPYRLSSLKTIIDQVRNNPSQGFVQVEDFQPYTPSYGVPMMFLAAPIYNGSFQVGIIVVQLSVDGINQITTANQDWESEGMGETGEVYLVGQDLLMRSASRLHIEQPEAYYNQLADEGVSPKTLQLIRRFDSPVLLQPVETEAAVAAVNGTVATNEVEDYRGVEVLSSYAPLSIEGLRWGILSEIDQWEAYQPLYSLQAFLLVLMAVVILLLTWLASLLAKRFLTPLSILVDGARQVSLGNHDVRVKVNSKDEFNELGQAFNKMADDLAAQDQRLLQKEQQNHTLLENMLPPAVIEQVKKGEKQAASKIQQATVLFARIIGISELSTELLPSKTAEIFNQLVNEFDTIAEEYELEKQNAIGSSYMAVCGLSKAYLDHPERTANFAFKMLEILPQINSKYGVNLKLRVGIHSGSINTGIVGTQKFMYNLWGQTITSAISIAYMNTQIGSNSIVVSQAIYERLHDEHTFIPSRILEIEEVGVVQTWQLIPENNVFSEQVSLVQTSFTQLLNRTDQTAKVFYDHLFEICPSFKPMFHTNMDSQRQQLMSTLQIAVNGLSNLKDILSTVQDLGRRHAGYGVKPEDYDPVGESLIYALQKQLGPKFTPEVKAAWIEAYSLLSGVMKSATIKAPVKTQETVEN
ncbi:MAG: adenylate/guanylate cyclase domain-containing protein [Microcoleaceae cyanobacterium]